MLSSIVQNNIEVLIAGAVSHMTGYRLWPGSATQEPLEHWDGGGQGKQKSEAFKCNGSIKLMRVWEKCFSVFSYHSLLPKNTA